MNKIQRVILFIVVVVMIAMLIYPPFHAQWKTGGVVYCGYHFIFSEDLFFKGQLKPEVTVSLLLTQWMGVLLVGAIAFLLASRRPKK